MPAERVEVKTRGDFADTRDMSMTSLPADIWFLVAVIAIVTVVMCLSILGALVEREHGIQKLAKDINDLKSQYLYSIAEPDEKSPILAELTLPSSRETDRDVPQR